MRTAAGMGTAAGLAALPFGAAAGWLRWCGYYLPDTRTAWMAFWLCGALLVFVLCTALPTQTDAESDTRWHCVSRRHPAEGLILPLAGASLLSMAGALGELCLRLPPVGAALWSGGSAAALAWLALCLLALLCRWTGE